MPKNSTPTSKYPEYETPEFTSKIPPHLVSQLDEKERWLMESISRLNSQADWLIEKQLDTNKAVRETDERLQDVEKWKSVLSGKWAILGGGGALLASGALSYAAKAALEKIFQ